MCWSYLQLSYIFSFFPSLMSSYLAVLCLYLIRIVPPVQASILKETLRDHRENLTILRPLKDCNGGKASVIHPILDCINPASYTLVYVSCMRLFKKGTVGFALLQKRVEEKMELEEKMDPRASSPLAGFSA